MRLKILQKNNIYIYIYIYIYKQEISKKSTEDSKIKYVRSDLM